MTTSEREVGDLDAYVDAMSAVVGLEIAPEHRPGVLRQLAIVLAAAALVAEFAIPDVIEPAPVFRP